MTYTETRQANRSGIVPIGDVTEAVATINPAVGKLGSSFNYIDLSAIDQDQKLISGVRSVAATEAPSRARQVVHTGDVLVSTVRPNLNGVARVEADHEGYVASTGFCVLRPKQGTLDSGFLFHWVRSPRFVDAMVNRATGASYPAVSDAIVRNSQILCLPIADQRRIAAILDQVDMLRAKRREVVAKFNAMGSALFLEVFGDPLGNPKGWRKVRMGEVGEIITGNTPYRQIESNYGNGIEWIKSDNINTGTYYATRASERLSSSGRLIARIAPPQSIRITCIAGSPNSIGNSAMLDREAAFNQQINAIVPKSCNPHFLYAQLRVGKKMVQEMSTEGMKGLVSKSRFEQIKVIVPPSDLQAGFAEQMLMIERTREASSEGLKVADTLFASLQHRAFRGEL